MRVLAPPPSYLHRRSPKDNKNDRDMFLFFLFFVFLTLKSPAHFSTLSLRDRFGPAVEPFGEGQETEESATTQPPAFKITTRYTRHHAKQ